LTDDNPLDRRISNVDAAQLLLAAAPALSTGATLIGDTGELAGLAFIDPKGDVGQYVLDQSHRTDEFDNQTRWTLIDRGSTAKILLEVDELTEKRHVVWRGVISFDYPQDRHALAVISQTAMLAVVADEAGNFENQMEMSDEQPPLFALTISTQAQLAEMLKIMDERNPVLEPVKPEDIVTGIRNSMARKTRDRNIERIRHEVNVGVDDMIRQGMVREDEQGRLWPLGEGSDQRATTTREELVERAVENQLDDLGEEMMSYVQSFRPDVQKAVAEAYISILHRKTPVWAGARGYALAYEECLRRVRIFRELGNNVDELTVLHCQLGVTMFDAHVLTVPSQQVITLPELDPREALLFMQKTPLPFDPLFIDFSGDDKLPTYDTPVAQDGYVKVLGVTCSTHPDQPEIVYMTPIFLYTSVHPPQASEPVALGSMAINCSGDPTATAAWIGEPLKFKEGHGAMIALAFSPILDRQPYLCDQYEKMIEAACGSAISTLNLLDYSNVEIVEKTLERREAKRAEKRNWNIPLVVRVSRPSRRVQNGSSQGLDSREFSHQFDVIGHPKHFTKGPMVACIVCGGKTSEEIPCARCKNTGLDPEKVEPCTRIDVVTGELTCPNGCRRIWCPPFVKGPEDAPYVPKTRKLV
jgi:hypothetical protein